MTKQEPDFSLIETILWENGGYFLLELHMERLKKSAGHFSFPLDRSVLGQVLDNLAGSFDPSERYRVRLLLERSGNFNITSDLLENTDDPAVKAAVSDERTDKNDIFYRYKTTKRDIYEEEFKKYRAKGFFDVIFTNQDNEVTEGAITNIIIKKDGHYWTPPLSCGLLPGVYREYLLREGKLPLKEKVLYPEDLERADRVFLINSVRKMVEAVISEQ
ncbi:MAG: aminotransferase class IV [Candidatus Omnitrophota bacterium]|nr:aminotransferase class IV [Candidatus Omnitrophota bacterium]